MSRCPSQSCLVHILLTWWPVCHSYVAFPHLKGSLRSHPVHQPSPIKPIRCLHWAKPPAPAPSHLTRCWRRAGVTADTKDCVYNSGAWHVRCVWGGFTTRGFNPVFATSFRSCWRLFWILNKYVVIVENLKTISGTKWDSSPIQKRATVQCRCMSS